MANAADPPAARRRDGRPLCRPCQSNTHQSTAPGRGARIAKCAPRQRTRTANRRRSAGSLPTRSPGSAQPAPKHCAPGHGRARRLRRTTKVRNGYGGEHAPHRRRSLAAHVDGHCPPGQARTRAPRTSHHRTSSSRRAPGTHARQRARGATATDRPQLASTAPLAWPAPARRAPEQPRVELESHGQVHGPGSGHAPHCTTADPPAADIDCTTGPPRPAPGHRASERPHIGLEPHDQVGRPDSEHGRPATHRAGATTRYAGHGSGHGRPAAATWSCCRWAPNDTVACGQARWPGPGGRRRQTWHTQPWSASPHGQVRAVT